MSEHGGARPGSGRWSKAALEAFARGDTDESIATIYRRSIEQVRAKRAGLLKPKLTGVSGTSLAQAVPAEPKAPTKQPSLFDPGMSARLIERSRNAAINRDRAPERNPFQIPSFPPKAMPPKKYQMAMDENLGWAQSQWQNGYPLAGPNGLLGAEGLQFLGYPFLAELTQRIEYRIPSEIIADEATRKWIDFDVTGAEADDDRKKQAKDEAAAALRGKPLDPDELKGRREDRVKKSGKAAKIKELKDDQARLELRDNMYAVCRDDGFFGRSHIFLNFGVDLDGSDPELATSIGDGRDETSRGKITKGSLEALQVVEAMWSYPTTYNAFNPLRPDWYRPDIWWVQQNQVHRTRMPVFVGRPVPNILKPAYAFGGLSLSQVMKPYVDIWLKTRESIGQLIHAFSVMVLCTDMQTILQPGGGGAEGLVARVNAFNALRDNQGTFLINKATEDFKNVSASLSGLHELQAQSQEHLMSTARIPDIKFTGINPSGLNASTDGTMRAFYDTISAYQGRFMRPNLTRIINFEQLSLWGAVDEEIVFDFEPLWEMSKKEEADLQKADGERHQIYVDMGAFSPEEIRGIAINDPKLPYGDLDPDDVPDLKSEEEQGLEPEGGRPDPDLTGKGPGGGGNNGGAPGGGDGNVIPFQEQAAATTTRSRTTTKGAADAEFTESDHPRAPDGKFGSGSGGGGKAHAGPQGHGGALDPAKLTKVGAQMGSNPGGVYAAPDGKKFYVKKGKSPEHVKNELIAASLYDLAGAPTLSYRPVKGGGHIATEMAKLDKDNASKLSPAEIMAAQADFVAHAWLGNWDVVGLGGDNLGTVGGKATPLDMGGALEYRAQGAPKGDKFGTKVGEINTLRDKNMNRDSARVFGSMTDDQMRESAKRVTEIPDDDVRETVLMGGGSHELADKLVARKKDIASRFGLATDDAFDGEWHEGDHPRGNSNNAGQFSSSGGGGSGGEHPLVGSQKITDKNGNKISAPRTFYRATNEGGSRVLTGDPNWDAHLFAASNVESARPYGKTISRIDAKPDARIVYEGTREFRELAAGLKGSLLDVSSGVTKRAVGKYDAVWFKRQSDVGTAILNPSAFIFRGMVGDEAPTFKEEQHPRRPDGKFGKGGSTGGKGGGAKKTDMPDLPGFLKRKPESEGGGAPGERQTFTMPQYGLTRPPSHHHDLFRDTPLTPEQKAERDKAYAERAAKIEAARQARLPKSSGEPADADATMVVEFGQAPPVAALNGVAFAPWEPPTDWADVEGQADIDEPELDVPEHKEAASGVVIREPDGRVWLMQPKGGFGGYDSTFPKGRAEEGLSLQANAIKEAWEETGLKVKITSVAGDYEGDTTMTRYYIAEREGGTPQDASWEAQSVALLPAGELGKALNRKRDREIASEHASMPKGAHDEANFEEGKHPRDADGKFSSTGGGEGAAKPAGLKHYKSPSTPQEFMKTAQAMIDKPAQKSSTFRWQLNNLIKEAPGFFEHPNEEFAQNVVASLKLKIAESWDKERMAALAKGDGDIADKIAVKMQKLGWSFVEGANKPAVAAPSSSAPLKSYGAYADAFKSAAQMADVDEMKKLDAKYAVWAEKLHKENPGFPNPAGIKYAAPPAPKSTPATAAELEKAKKNIALKLQYVPGAPSDSPAAQKLVDKFNEKWAGKEIANQPDKLQEKVDDFKAMQAAMIPLMSAQQQAQAKAQAEQQANAAKSKAEQQAQAQAHAAQQAAALKAQAEQAKQKNAHVMKELGITESEAEGFNALVEMLGGKQGDVIQKFKSYEEKAKGYGYPITGFQTALISNYSDGGYGGINKALRSGSWTVAQHVYAKLMNKALQSMPKYHGIARRGTSLPSDEQAKYKVGHVVQEHGFTSSSPTKPWSGNTQFTITAIGKRGAHIKKLSSHPGEDEVVFSARTYFKVTKVEGAPGGSMHVHMEELEHDV